MVCSIWHSSEKRGLTWKYLYAYGLKKPIVLSTSYIEDKATLLGIYIDLTFPLRGAVCQIATMSAFRRDSTRFYLAKALIGGAIVEISCDRQRRAEPT